MTDITATIPSALRADVNEGLLVRTAALLRQAALAQRDIGTAAEDEFARTFSVPVETQVTEFEGLAEAWMQAERLRCLVVHGKPVEITRSDFDHELALAQRNLQAEERDRANETADRYVDHEIS